MASAAQLANLFGPELLTKNGLKPTEEVLKGAKHIGIYFSAHWCPPCRGFTPVLGEFYNAVKQSNPGELEIVFVSSDSDESSFDGYFESMPWNAIPFGGDQSQELGSSYGVRGIPTFIILDGATLEIKDRDGRSTVAGCKGNVAEALNRWNL